MHGTLDQLERNEYDHTFFQTKEKQNLKPKRFVLIVQPIDLRILLESDYKYILY